MNYSKRFSVDLDGHTVATFDELEQAREWIYSCWWLSLATIYDHNKKELVESFIRL